jgi:hypothetical protein
MDKAKRATVYIKVTEANGDQCSGSGFFGVADARNLVLTNAHVVGMLSADSRPPRAVEVITDSGQPGERHYTARVIGVDRSSDLAVLDVGTAAGLPEPLVVKDAAGLRELNELYTFGFPLGERLGKEITIRPTSVSSLRKKAGVLDRIQVNGGMDPGNSGGPVVDVRGHVVGVAVAGIEGRLINFAIPGERVRGLLNGRLSEMALHQPFIEGDRVSLPVILVLIDPREKVREVALDVWVGDKPAEGRPPVRPASDAEPAPQPGDSPRQRTVLPYDRAKRQARGDVLLPPKSDDKVYWVQANLVNANGDKHWVTAHAFAAPAPVERKPAMLALNAGGGAGRLVNVQASYTFRVSGEEDADGDEGVVAQLRAKAQLNEQAAGGGQGMKLRLQYQQAAAEAVVDKEVKAFEVPPGLRLLAILMQFDPRGNLVQSGLDQAALRKVLAVPNQQWAQQTLRQIHRINEPIKNALNTLAVPLPGRQVSPGESWTSVRQVQAGMDDDRPAQLEMKYTYVGQRTNAQGRAEAVLTVTGVMRGQPGKEAQVGGKAAGSAVLDLATGQLTRCDLKVTTDTEMTFFIRGGSLRNLRVLNIQVAHLEASP